MSEPDEVRFACIGCGAMNRAGSPACSGCGHIFAGPQGTVDLEPQGTVDLEHEPAPALEYPEPGRGYRYRGPISDGSTLGCVGAVVGITLTVILAPFAFVIAFFATCTGLPEPNSEILLYSLSLMAGLLAAGAVIAACVAWINWISRMDRGSIERKT